MSLPVTFTTTGSSFSPKVTLTAGSSATVTWACPSASITTTGLNPTLSFGSAATRVVYMTVLDSNGYEAIDQVAVLNLGYNHANDNGTYSLPSSYDYAAQPVSAVEGVRNMAGLTAFLAANISALQGTLDFTGLAQLTNVELYDSSAQQILLAGCTSLLRLCAEANKLTFLDLNPVADNVREVRAAAQQGGSLTLAPLNRPLLNVYHFCLRDQTVTNMPNLAAQLPAVKELWIWNTGQTGALAPGSTVLTNVQAYSNSYTSATFASPSFSATPTFLDLHDCNLTSVTVPATNGLGYVDLSGNDLPNAQVNSILANLAGGSVSGGGATVNLTGTGNGYPTGSGVTAVSTLLGRSWSVSVNAGPQFAHADTGHNSSTSATSLGITLSGAVAAGDLLVLYVNSEGGGPANVSVSDSASNTWATVGGSAEVWYCLSSAAAAGGVTITVATTGGYYAHQIIADRFTPTGTVTYGGNAATGSSTTEGLNYNATGCGNLGTVPAGALAWGAFSCGSNAGDQAYTAGYQTGTTAPANAVGSQFNGSSGTGLSVYAADAANENATLTWYGTGTGAFGHGVSAYFTV